MWDKRRLRHFFLFNGILVAFALAVAVYMLLLDRYGAPFFCAFSRSTHLYCPGCGFTRAVRALLSFDILGSLGAHPFALVGIGVIAYYEVALLRAARHHGSPRAWPAILFAFGLLAFFLLRNLLLIFFGLDYLGDFRQDWGIFVG